jgi:hypothetical protein
VTFVLGNPPEDSTLPVPWPYALPMVGPWSGICPRPTQVPPSDVEHGLSSNIHCATSGSVALNFPLQTFKTLNSFV